MGFQDFLEILDFLVNLDIRDTLVLAIQDSPVTLGFRAAVNQAIQASLVNQAILGFQGKADTLVILDIAATRDFLVSRVIPVSVEILDFQGTVGIQVIPVFLGGADILVRATRDFLVDKATRVSLGFLAQVVIPVSAV